MQGKGSPTYLMCRKKRRYSGCFVYMSATKAFRQRLRFRSTPDNCAWTEQPQSSMVPRFQEGVFRALACTLRTPVTFFFANPVSVNDICFDQKPSTPLANNCQVNPTSQSEFANLRLVLVEDIQRRLRFELVLYISIT